MYRLIALVVFLFGISPSFALGADDDWEVFIAKDRAYEDLLSLSQSLADAISNGKDEELSTLAAKVRAETPARFLPLVEDGIWGAFPVNETEMPEASVAHLNDSGVFPDARTAQAAYDNLRSCPIAGLLLKHLIVGVASNDMQPRAVDGRMVLDGTTADSAFARHFARCQLLGSHAWTASPIGYHPLACRPDRESCPDPVDR